MCLFYAQWKNSRKIRARDVPRAHVGSLFACPVAGNSGGCTTDNFRNLFLHSPNGKKDGLQLIPVSEVAARDEFTGIKSVTRDDVLASLRIPPQLLGIVPQNAGGFGSIREAASVWAGNELAPIQRRLARVNDWIGYEVISFDEFDPAQVAQ